MMPAISSKTEILKGLNGIQDIPIMVVGDLVLDRYVWGKVTRVSQEAPVPIVEVLRTEDRLGGAANAALNLKSVGARPILAGVIGKDQEGEILLSLCAKAGIEIDTVSVVSDRATALKTRVIGAHQHMLRVDREKVGHLSDHDNRKFIDAVRELLGRQKAVIVSDYGKGVVSEDLMACITDPPFGKQSGRIISVDPSPKNYGLYRQITMAKPNRAEAEIATGVRITDTAQAEKAGRILLNLWDADIILVSLGEDGIIVVERGKEALHRPTRARQVFDVSGAGDTVTAVFTAALASGVGGQVAADLANLAAGLVVMEVGTVPVKVDSLRKAIDSLP